MKLLAVSIAVALCLVAGGVLFSCVGNARVERELRENPGGERAKKVMLLSLPSGRTLPVNYLREGSFVYAGADGRWWRELRGEGGLVRVWIQGRELAGHGRAIEDDPERRAAVFARLRPSAPLLFGTLVEIRLD